MAGSGIGYLIARRGGYLSWPLGFAFISAPIIALYQKRELDFYEITSTSMYVIDNLSIHPKQLAE
jgi:hypothetical protein